MMAPCRFARTCCRLLTSRSFSHGDQETALIHVAAVLDPISETAQKWAPLLKVGTREISLQRIC